MKDFLFIEKEKANNNRKFGKRFFPEITRGWEKTILFFFCPRGRGENAFFLLLLKRVI